jgi:protein-L-isoaspartate(D-aspartate) O-methyltransferase
MTADLVRLREQLAAQVGATVASPAVEGALRDVPRHLFVPGVPPAEAYRDEAIVTKRDRSGVPVSSSSQPAIMALMLDQLDLKPGHRVLEIGAGTGYNAALMSHIVGPGGQVTSVDIDPDVVAEAAAHLAAAGYPDVTVVCADGAEGCADQAPYDRLIATVGVSDLAPAWLRQVTPDALIVVPLDVRGAQLSVAFERAGGHWASRSVVPCGFMRMRGALAGPPVALVPLPGLTLMLSEERTVDSAALAAALTAPPDVTEPAGVNASAPQVFWGLNLWLAVREPRACELAEEPGRGRDPRLARAPFGSRGYRGTYGIVSEAGGIAVLSAAESGLVADGYGPDSASLAAELAAQVRAWASAGRPATEGLHVDAYPRDAGAAPGTAERILERPSTRFALYRA